MAMRYLSVILSVVALTMLSAGCTRNNGDIGPWFGTWQVTRIDVDGVPAADYRGNVVMKFQSHVMESRAQSDNHSYSAYWCTWSESDGSLRLEITPGDDASGYVAELMIPWTPVNMLRIVNQTGKTACLSRRSGEGTEYVYYLKKLY